MQIDRLSRITASAWLATAVARVVVAVGQAGPSGHGGSLGTLALGAGDGQR